MNAMAAFITVVWTHTVRIMLEVTNANARLVILGTDTLVSTLMSATLSIEINLVNPYTNAVRVQSASIQSVLISVNVR